MKHSLPGRLIPALLAAALLLTPASAFFWDKDPDTTAEPVPGETVVENNAPIAQNLSFKTYKNISLSGSFSAIDPEGDLLHFSIQDKPARGEITLSDDDGADFVYTPYTNKTGKDSFTYVVTDDKGNVSAPATVRVKIEKPGTRVHYEDMEGEASHNAAIRLAEEDIFVGECLGDSYFFSPEKSVSRSEFLAMALNAGGINRLSQVEKTGFADDDSIASWARPYAATALKAGIISGKATGAGVVFSPDGAITLAEAAVILNRVLEITDVSANLDNTPTWAAQAAANLQSCGILPRSSQMEKPLTRADAALMLAAALDALEARA